MKISKGTIIRTALLVLAIINNILSIVGKPVLPVTDEQLELLISTLFTIVVSLVNWWKNNSFTKHAIEADRVKDELKKAGA